MIEFLYRNRTSKMLVHRCIGAENFFLEKLILPDEIVLLPLPQDSKVEIWGSNAYGPHLEERFRVTQRSSEEAFAA